MKIILLFFVHLLILLNFELGFSQEFLKYKITISSNESDTLDYSKMTDSLFMEHLKTKMNPEEKYCKIYENYWTHVFGSRKLISEKNYIIYDSISIEKPILPFMINDSYKTNVAILEALRENSNTKFRHYKITDDGIFVTKKSSLKKVFSFAKKNPIIKSHLGISELIKYYDELYFFGRRFNGVYKYYFHSKVNGSGYSFIIWIDKAFKLIRFEYLNYGFIRID